MKKTNKLDSFFYLKLFVFFVFSFLFLFQSNLGPIDDHIFTYTFEKGRFIVLGIEPDSGRFLPLHGQLFNLISLFTTSTTFFYFINFIQYSCFLFGFNYLLNQYRGYSKSNFIFALFIVLQPAFTESFFRLHIMERNSSFWFFLYVFTYFKFTKNESNTNFILCILFANLGIYYKDPGFILIGFIGIFNLIGSWSQISKKRRLLNFAHIFSSATFIGLYLYFIFPYIGERYSSIDNNIVLETVKNISRLIIYNPLLFLPVNILLLKRLFDVFISKKSKLDALHDSLLVAGVIYICVFLYLNMSSSYYLLPVYVFIFLPLAKYSLDLELFFKRSVLTKGLYYLFILLFFGSMMNGLYRLGFNKYNAKNHYEMRSFVGSKIKLNKNKQDIFIYGIDSDGKESEIYRGLVLYLEAMGLNENDFDIKSYTSRKKLYKPQRIIAAKDAKTTIDLQMRELPYTAFMDLKASIPKKGDLVVLTPYTILEKSNKDLIKDLEKSGYKLLLSTKSPFLIPDYSTKTLLKFLSIELGLSQAFKAKNLFRSSDYYVLIYLGNDPI